MTPASLPTLIGLAVALGGPALLASPLHRWLGDEDALRTRLIDQICLLALAAGVVAIVVRGEARPLASLGWRPAWDSLAWGALLAFVFLRVVIPVEIRLRWRLGLDGAGHGLVRLARLPVPVLVCAAVVAGVVEETLFRGYAFTRIAELSDSEVFAGLLTVAVFAPIHLRLWGWGPVVSAANAGVLTAFFAWRHDLLANIVAHALTDLVGLFEAARRARSRPEVAQTARPPDNSP